MIDVIGGSLINNGTIILGSTPIGGQPAALNFSGDSTLGGSGEIVLVNGRITGGGTVTVASTQTLRGWGGIAVSISNEGTIAADLASGSLTMNSLVLFATSSLHFQVSSLNQRGYLGVSSPVILDGKLVLDFASDSGLQSAAPDSASITILTATSIGDSFDNVANGSRLMTSDGSASFVVNYGLDSSYGPDKIVLSDMVLVPEPGTCAFLLTLAIVSLLRRDSHRN